MFRKIISTGTNTSWLITRSYVKRGGNPGLNKQIKKLQLEKDDLEDPEGIADAEADFMNVHEMHKQHEKEIRQQREKVNLFIVKNKYFKEKKPNFLTWAEKEQIRLLNSQEPEEYTPEILSEKFPADVETVGKIIKAKWTPRTQKRIEQHDQQVTKNWQDFREGKFINLDKHLKDHLEKFPNQYHENLHNLKLDWVPKPHLPKPKVNEFSSIITSCPKYRDEQKQIGTPEAKIIDVEPWKIPSVNSDDTFIMDTVKDKKPARLKDLKEQGRIESTINENVKLESTQIQPVDEILKARKFESNEIEIRRDEVVPSDAAENFIPENVKIPRKLWKRGATYRIEDCYFDDDGEFLYKVPGMTGIKSSYQK